MPKGKLIGTLLLLALASPALAQPAPRGGRRGGPPDPQRMRQRLAEQMKEALDVTDEQWKTMEPKIEKIRELQRDLRTGGPMGMMFGPGPGRPPPGFGGPGGPNGPGPRGGPNGRPPRPNDEQGGPGANGRPPRPDDAPEGRGPGARPPWPDQAPEGTGPNDRPPRPDNGPGPDRSPRANAPPPGGPDAPPPPPPDGARPGPRGQRHSSQVQEKFDDLQEALDDKNAKDEDLKAKIDAYRQARAQAKAELAKAQDELRGMVKPMQEAVLITMGVLDFP